MPHLHGFRRGQLTAMVSRIAARVYRPLVDLEVSCWKTPEPVPFARRTSGKRIDIRPGDKWGELVIARDTVRVLGGVMDSFSIPRNEPPQ